MTVVASKFFTTNLELLDPVLFRDQLNYHIVITNPFDEFLSIITELCIQANLIKS